MPRLIVPALVLTLAACGFAQPTEPLSIISEKLADGFAFTEGPALGPDGAIYFSDIPKRKVHRFDPATGQVTVFMEDSGGSNGLHWDKEGRLVLCADKSRKVTRRENTGEVTVLEDAFNSKKLNSPNDLDIDADGGIYFTDPSWAKRENRDMDEMGVYYIPPMFVGRIAPHLDDTGMPPTSSVPPESLDVKQLITDLQKPNGVALSPDDQLLYVADNGAGLVMAYDIVKPGKLANARIFAKPTAGTKGGPDGMTTDAQGNLYAAWYGANTVFVWNPAGQLIATIAYAPDQPTNVELADNDTTLYITGGKSLHRAKLDALKK